MFKLLTEEVRKKVAHEYAYRRAVVVVVALVIILIVAMVGLFPADVLSRARKQEITERLRIIGNLELKKSEIDLKAWLTSINLKLNTLNPKLDVDRPSVYIEQVLEKRVAGIKLTNLSWVKSDNKSTISISGIANDRQTLIAFENSLNASGYFDTVSLPISNLARDKNINFQVKLSPLQTP
jgi:hypothetical protein